MLVIFGVGKIKKHLWTAEEGYLEHSPVGACPTSQKDLAQEAICSLELNEKHHTIQQCSP